MYCSKAHYGLATYNPETGRWDGRVYKIRGARLYNKEEGRTSTPLFNIFNHLLILEVNDKEKVLHIELGYDHSSILKLASYRRKVSSAHRRGECSEKRPGEMCWTVRLFRYNNLYTHIFDEEDFNSRSNIKCSTFEKYLLSGFETLINQAWLNNLKKPPTGKRKGGGSVIITNN